MEKLNGFSVTMKKLSSGLVVSIFERKSTEELICNKYNGKSVTKRRILWHFYLIIQK